MAFSRRTSLSFKRLPFVTASGKSLTLALMILFVGSGVAIGQGGTADDELFENLESDLFDGLEDLPDPQTEEPKPQPPPSDESTEKPPGKSPGAGSDSNPPEFDPLPGEDIGQPPETSGERISTENPLFQVSESMRTVESRIRSEDTSPETQQLQKDILNKLDELIAAAEQQQKKPSPSSSGQNSPNNSQDQPENQNGDEANQPQQQPQAGTSAGRGGPARESTTDGDPVTGGEVELSGQNVLMKRVWGQLPAKIREEILTQSVEEFLPEYRNLIEDYYKRLAKESSNSP